jgi:hypothetical protein
MKYLDYLYFNIYHHFHKVSQYRPTFNPRLQAMYLFSMGLGGWLLLLEALYLHLLRHAWFSSPAQSTVFTTSVYLLSAVLFNHIFIQQDRDLKIFEKYEKKFNQHPRRSLHLILSVIFLSTPYLVLFINVIFFPRHR